MSSRRGTYGNFHVGSSIERVSTVFRNFLNDLMLTPFFVLSFLSTLYKYYSYALGVVVLPGVLIVAGLVSIFFFNFFLICRCCCSCLKCAPNEVDITENPEKVIKSRHRVCFFFFFFLLLMVLADHLLYYGNADIDAGADNLVDAADRLKLIFNSIIVQTANINSYTAVVDQILTVTNTCKDISGNPAAGPMAGG